MKAIFYVGGGGFKLYNCRSCDHKLEDLRIPCITLTKDSTCPVDQQRSMQKAAFIV